MNFWQSLPKPILALAPMEGVTDIAFRTVCKQAGAQVVYTEFVSSDAVAYGAKKVLEKLQFTPAEQPVVAQIFGHNPTAFAEAAKKIEQLGFSGVDINLGCPARKVIHSGSGAALLRDPLFARQLVEAALGACSLPVSVKIRTSIRRSSANTERVTVLDFLEAIHDLPVAAIMVHGRSYEDGHSGTVDTDMIKQVKSRTAAVVLANGGIMTAADVPAMLAATGADGVGIARGAWGSPWIFSEAAALLATGRATPTTWATKRQLAFEHARLLLAKKSSHGLLEFRKHLARYASGFRGAAELRRLAVRVETLADVERVLDACPSS